MVRRFWLVVLGALLATGCTDTAADPQPPSGAARDAGVLTAVIVSVAELTPEPEKAPVVYVVGSQGTLGIEVQAAVAMNLANICDLRFADDPSEAYEEIDGELRLREGALLLEVGAVPSEGDQVEVAVTRHVAADFSEDLVVVTVLQDLDWAVTEVTVTEVSASTSSG
jgi:hypothetical protein